MKRNLWWFLPITLFSLWFALPPSITPQALSFSLFNKKFELAPNIRYGLDLQGGAHLLFLIDTQKLDSRDASEASAAIRTIVERRVNPYGKEEPQITILKNQGQYRLSVDLPGIKNTSEAIRLIGQTAKLDFREVQIGEKKQGTKSATTVAFKKTNLTGQYLKKAALVFDQNTGKPEVSLRFDQRGKKLFAEITKKNLQKPLAIFLDNQLLTAPVVQSEITTGEAVINGQFTTKEAKDLVLALNSGALPCPLVLLEQKTIEPTLGKDNIEKSLVAGIVGLISLVIFLIVLYRVEGVIAGCAFQFFQFIYISGQIWVSKYNAIYGRHENCRTTRDSNK
jgi:preprotein translocase subunit SecD